MSSPARCIDGLDLTCVYFATGFGAPGELSLLVRGRIDNTAPLRAAVAAAVNAVEPDAPFQFFGLRQMVGGLAWVFGAFSAAASLLGALGLLLAFSGTFAVVSFLVAQRTREFGVRLALGATVPRIVSGMLGETLRTASFGSGGWPGRRRWPCPRAQRRRRCRAGLRPARLRHRHGDRPREHDVGGAGASAAHRSHRPLIGAARGITLARLRLRPSSMARRLRLARPVPRFIRCARPRRDRCAPRARPGRSWTRRRSAAAPRPRARMSPGPAAARRTASSSAAGPASSTRPVR